MRWMVGAEGSRFIESQGIREGRRFGGRGQQVAVGLTHAVDSETDEVACGVPVAALTVFDLDWEMASVERCPDCVQVVGAI